MSAAASGLARLRVASPPSPVAGGRAGRGSAPVAAPAQDPVESRVLAIVAEKTGYASEMLALDLDLEADLGVDTVSRRSSPRAVREEWGHSARRLPEAARLPDARPRHPVRPRMAALTWRMLRLRLPAAASHPPPSPEPLRSAPPPRGPRSTPSSRGWCDRDRESYRPIRRDARPRSTSRRTRSLTR